MQKTTSLTLIGLFTAVHLTAVPLDTTRFDGQAGNGASAPWAGTSGLGAAFEDNETEPTTLTGDEWDLEALVYDSSSSRLSVVGTFDFVNGVPLPGHPVNYGAIFLRAAAAASWAYAYVLDFAGNTYSLFDNFSTIAPTEVLASGPYTIDTATANLLGSGNFLYSTGLPDPFGLGLQSGGGHNQIDLDLNLLPAALLAAFDVHTTMTCGNDTLEGRFVLQSGSPVPDAGSTALLLACAVSGLAAVRRRFRP